MIGLRDCWIRLHDDLIYAGKAEQFSVRQCDDGFAVVMMIEGNDDDVVVLGIFESQELARGILDNLTEQYADGVPIIELRPIEDLMRATEAYNRAAERSTT